MIDSLLGLGVQPEELTFPQIALRGAVVFIIALVMVRLGDKRFLSKKTAFDAILGFILASMLARAVNGSAPFFPTLVAGFVLVALHRIIAAIAFYSEFFGFLVKGKSDVLLEQGNLKRKTMQAHKISENDLLEEARLHGKVDSLQEVKLATIERSGQISVIPGNEKS